MPADPLADDTVDDVLLHRLADAADAVTLPRFRTGLSVQNKLDGEGAAERERFDPVTEADRAAEAAILDLLATLRPDDAVQGEEFGTKGEGPRRWVIDPVDGTRAFICGLPSWGTLVGYLEEGRARAGIMSQPFTGERFLAWDGRAEWTRGRERGALRTRATRTLSESRLFTTDPRLMAGAKATAFEALSSRVRLTRFGMDCYAFAMLAAGEVDLVVECGLQPYDIAALVPIVEAAGGVVTTWDGGRAEGGGDVIAAATADLHAAASEILNPA